MQRAFGAAPSRRPASRPLGRRGRGLRAAAAAACAAARPAAASAAASSASRSFFVLRLCLLCFFFISSCWRAINSCALRSPRPRARRAPRAAIKRRRRRLGRFLDDAAAASGSSRLTKTRFLRTSTWMVRALPVESAALISLVCLRVSVIFFFGSPAAPCCLLQVVEQPVLSCSDRLSPCFLPSTPALRELLEQRARRHLELRCELFDGRMRHVLLLRPALGRIRFSVASARRPFVAALPRLGRRLLEPMRARLHDQVLRAILARCR